MEYIHTNNRIILSTGTVLLDETDSTLTLPLQYDNKIIASIAIHFSETKDKEGSEIVTKGEGDTIKLECINFREELDRFTIKPLVLGAYNGKELSIQIFSTLNGRTEKIRGVEYTIYLEK